MSNIVTGIDIGGSHITAALVDLDAHALLPGTTVRMHVNAKGSAEQIIKAWANAITTCKQRNPNVSNKIGIAMPGPCDYENGISLVKGLDKFDSLYTLNLKTLLAEKLSVDAAGIYMSNDASCFLKGELFGGAARYCENVLGITLGTGLGSAIYKNGVMLDGDLYCTPYKDACAEDYVSTRWFIESYEAISGIKVENVKELAQQVAFNAQAAQVFRRFGENLGEVLLDYLNMHQLDVLVIGGNIMQAWDLFIPATMQVFNAKTRYVKIHKAVLGEEAALLGAGSLCV